MKTPICHFCNRLLTEVDRGKSGLVKFADYQQPDSGFVGHPLGMEWFCSEHYQAALKYSNLPVAQAVSQMENDKVEKRRIDIAKSKTWLRAAVRRVLLFFKKDQVQ